MPCITPNPRRVGYIDPIHGPLDGPLYMGSIYSNNKMYIHLTDLSHKSIVRKRACGMVSSSGICDLETSAKAGKISWRG